VSKSEEITKDGGAINAEIQQQLSIVNGQMTRGGMIGQRIVKPPVSPEHSPL